MTNADKQRKEQAYYKMLQHYETYQTDWLENLEKSGAAGGVYLLAIQKTLEIRRQLATKIEEANTTPQE